jgi:hypothetical protein
VASAAGREAGLLVAGDHVLVVAETDAVERAGVEAEYAGGFDGELRVVPGDKKFTVGIGAESRGQK